MQVGAYQYRLTAWNSMGWSDFAVSEVCSTANASLPCNSPACHQLNNCAKKSSSLSDLPLPESIKVKWRVLPFLSLSFFPFRSLPFVLSLSFFPR